MDHDFVVPEKWLYQLPLPEWQLYQAIPSQHAEYPRSNIHLWVIRGHPIKPPIAEGITSGEPRTEG